MAISSIPTGARMVLSFNGQPVAYARSVAISEQIDYAPIEILGSIRVKEFVPQAYRITISCSTVRIIGTTLKSQGFFGKTAQNASQQLLNILNTGDLVATLEDSVSGAVIATVQGVKIAGHSFSLDSRGLIMEDVEMVGVSVSDESEAS